MPLVFLGPVGGDGLPRPLVIRVVVVAVLEGGVVAGLGVQGKAFLLVLVVDLLLGLLVLPGAGVVAGPAPLDDDLVGGVGVRAPLAGSQLTFCVQTEQLISAVAVTTGCRNLK